MSGEDDDEALKARRDRLAGDLEAARTKPAAPPHLLRVRGPAGLDGSMAMKAASEFVAAVIVGAALGYGLDWLLHAKPVFTIVFFLLGVTAGVWNLIRATSPKGGK